MDDSGKPPSPPPPWGYGPVTPAPSGKPRKYQGDHGKATAHERQQRFRERAKAQGKPTSAAANRAQAARAAAVVGTAHELLPRAKTRDKVANLGTAVGRWKPGQSGNPKGMQGARLYIEAQRICRDASPNAAMRMVELMDDQDTRVAYMATNMILERAWGKPREYDPATDPENQVRIDVRRLSDEERGTLRKLMQQAVAVGGRSDEDDSAD